MKQRSFVRSSDSGCGVAHERRPVDRAGRDPRGPAPAARVCGQLSSSGSGGARRQRLGRPRSPPATRRTRCAALEHAVDRQQRELVRRRHVEAIATRLTSVSSGGGVVHGDGASVQRRQRHAAQRRHLEQRARARSAPAGRPRCSGALRQRARRAPRGTGTRAPRAPKPHARHAQQHEVVAVVRQPLDLSMRARQPSGVERGAAVVVALPAGLEQRERDAARSPDSASRTIVR